ncbi:MAG: phosphoglucosamine mutase, partial [Polynucleobacter victoriensis]
IEAEGILFTRAKVGDRYVLEQLKEKNWLLGGEGSGHLICLDKHTTGDGIVAALQVLTAMKQGNQTLAQLLQKVTLFPQTLINVRYKQGYQWQSDANMKDA